MRSKRSEYGVLHGFLRLLAFAIALLWAGLMMLLRRPRTLRERSLWKQRMCLLIARCMGMEIDVIGRVPVSGMIVSNHLSYLDAVVFGALVPAVFVAKAEVRRWPLVGWLTASGGTIFLQRDNVRMVADVNRRLVTTMAQGTPTMIFPEGTTTGATDPLPFHPALFEPAVRGRLAVWPSALAYSIDGRSADVPERVCYWADMTFVPHLVKLMRQRNVRAVVRFADGPVMAASRTEAAALSQSAVTAMLHDGLRHTSMPRAASVRVHQAAAAQTLQH